jgi:hypothetical protein
MSNLSLSLNPNPNPNANTEPHRASPPGGTDTRLEIDATRSRQTERPAAPFRSVLAGGVSLLMTGAEVATHVVAGPVLAAAVHDARVGASSAIAGGAMPGGPVGPGSPPAALAAAAATGNPEMANMEAVMQQGQASNLQLLALQQQVQQENQRFTTVSNVMRAKHDTAKAAVSNIRA